MTTTEPVVPYVPKTDVTIIAVGDAIEANAVRVLLEGFNYRVTVHWVGSRAELVKLLDGEIPTDDLMVMSCHGDPTGILIDGEPSVTPADLAAAQGLPGKTILSTGCLTGTPVMTTVFRQAGVSAYIAPTDYPDGSAALIFAGNLFYLLTTGISIKEAVHRAAAFAAECEQFKLITR